MQQIVISIRKRRFDGHSASLLKALLSCVLVLSAEPVTAQTLFPAQSPQTLQSPKALALPPQASPPRRQLTGTGFFVDDTGHLITARHVVANCMRVLVAKENR